MQIALLPCAFTAATVTPPSSLERCFRDAPLVIAGAGTTRSGAKAIVGQLVECGGLDR